MIDTDLIVESLRRRGHTVESVIPVPENAGEWEFIVDGVTLNLDETRALLEADQTKDAEHGIGPDGRKIRRKPDEPPPSPQV